MKNNLFVLLLTALFVTLKLTSIIDWSWLWVLSPAPISFGIGFVRGVVKTIMNRTNDNG
jgi:hypothetical protein